MTTNEKNLSSISNDSNSCSNCSSDNDDGEEKKINMYPFPKHTTTNTNG